MYAWGRRGWVHEREKRARERREREMEGDIEGDRKCESVSKREEQEE